MCYNTKYVGYEQNEENRSVYYLWGGVTLPASCGLAVCPGCEETKKDMPEGEKHTWRKH